MLLVAFSADHCTGLTRKHLDIVGGCGGIFTRLLAVEVLSAQGHDRQVGLGSVPAGIHIPAVAGPLVADEGAVFGVDAKGDVLTVSTTIIKLHLVRVAVEVDVDHGGAVTGHGDIGVGVVVGEAVVELAGILTPYYGVSIKCIT